MKKYLNASFAFALILMASSESESSTRGSIKTGGDTTGRIFYETSSNYRAMNDGSMAIDDNRSTAWISDFSNGEHWITIDFGTKRLLTSIVVHLGEKDGFHTVRRFKLQFSYRGEWFDFAEIECEQKAFPGRRRYFKRSEIDPGGVDASRFRILIPEGGTYAGYASIADIEVWLGSGRISFNNYDERLRGMQMPVKNGIFPADAHGYPNAPRDYRGGRHVGIDIYNYHKDESAVPVDRNTPVVAAASGTVIRADHDYEPLSPQEWRAQSNYYRRNPQTFVKNSFGGIQVWIDHGDGVLTSYNHLSKIPRSIKTGSRVRKGGTIGFAGNTGLLGDSEGTDQGIHLHFEIWIDGYYLGYGMNLQEIKKYLHWIFYQPD